LRLSKTFSLIFRFLLQLSFLSFLEDRCFNEAGAFIFQDQEYFHHSMIFRSYRFRKYQRRVPGAVVRTECSYSDPFQQNFLDLSWWELSKISVDFFVAGDQFVSRKDLDWPELELSKGVVESRLTRSVLWSHAWKRGTCLDGTLHLQVHPPWCCSTHSARDFSKLVVSNSPLRSKWPVPKNTRGSKSGSTSCSEFSGAEQLINTFRKWTWFKPAW